MAGVWRYPADASVPAVSTVGYAIEASDGFVGTVAVAREEPAGAYLIALGGPWNGGRSLMIPAGAIKRVEREARVLHLSCSRQQLRDAPAYESDRYQDAAFRGELAAYYESLKGGGSRLAGFAAALRAAPLGPGATAFAARLVG
jgi:hypothetical protein